MIVCRDVGVEVRYERTLPRYASIAHKIKRMSEISIHCNKCKTNTNQSQRFHQDRLLSEEVVTIGGNQTAIIQIWNESFVFECGGCKQTQYGERIYSNDDLPDLPPLRWFPQHEMRTAPDWLSNVSTDLQTLHKEVRDGLNSGLRILPMTGIRTAVDLFIRQHVGDRTFDKGIKQLKERGTISEPQLQLLKPVIEAGHAAAHRSFEPTLDQLNSALDVLEHLLRTKTLVQPVDGLKRATPVRPTT